jgi:ribosomal protein L29
MKIKELSQKDDKTLAKLLADTKAKLVKDRFNIASRELAQVSEVKKSRKLIAQINTVIHEREIAAKEAKTAKEAEKKIEKPAKNVEKGKK